MNKSTPGGRLRAARKLQNRTQDCVGAAAGLSQSRMSQIELGKRYPTSEEWKKLQAILGALALGALPPRNLPAPSEGWRIRPRRISSSAYPFSSRRRSAQKKFGSLFERRLEAVLSREDGDLAQQFLEQAGLDSSLEALVWTLFLEAGARPCSWSISNAGFEAHRVVDLATKLNRTHAPRPCLEMDFADFGLLLFPQVSVDVRTAYYRLDALACLRAGEERIWLNLEFDGRGHDPEFDSERQQKLGLPTIRLSQEDVTSTEPLIQLERKLSAVLRRTQTAQLPSGVCGLASAGVIDKANFRGIKATESGLLERESSKRPTSVA